MIVACISDGKNSHNYPPLGVELARAEGDIGFGTPGIPNYLEYPNEAAQ